MGLGGGSKSSSGSGSGDLTGLLAGLTANQNQGQAQANQPDYSDPNDPQAQARKKLLTQQQADALAQSGQQSVNAVNSSLNAAKQLMGQMQNTNSMYAQPDYSA